MRVTNYTVALAIGFTYFVIVTTATAAAGAERKPAADYATTAKRLNDRYSLDRVAREHIEVGARDLVGLTGPITQRVPIQARTHPDIVFVLPDLSVTLGITPQALAIGFALGSPARLPAVEEPVHRLHKGYQPIVESVWKQGALEIVQTAFVILPQNDEVVAGTEKQYVMVRMAVTNTGKNSVQSDLWVLVGRPLVEDYNAIHYAPYVPPTSRWQQDSPKVAVKPNGLLLDGRALLSWRTSMPDIPQFANRFQGHRTESEPLVDLHNGLRFGVKLGPKETQTIDLVIAGNTLLGPADELQQMASFGFDQALAHAEAYWDRPLAQGTQLITPEPLLNNIHKHLVLSLLQNWCKTPNRPWVKPVHSPIYSGVWPWEFAGISEALCSLGFGRRLEPCLQFFTETQSGIGKYSSEATHGTDAEVKSRVGCYAVGQNGWTNETGSVLSALASYFRYSRNVEWLKADRPGILAAWDWIQNERKATRVTQADGKKVPHFGLLPKGSPHDWGGHRYHYSFSDAYTYKGMAEMAAAFRDAKLPEADRMVHDAEEYRHCILDVVERVQYVSSVTGLLFVPNTVYYQQGERGGLWILDGPRSLFDTGVLDPVSDPRWEPMAAMFARNFSPLMGMMGRFQQVIDDVERTKLAADSLVWYVCLTEAGWYRDFLARGEVEKSLLVFYSNLVYAMSSDCHQMVERLNFTNDKFCPWQPNSSANGRTLDMMRRMVIDEQDVQKGVLWLLRGCPRRWFAKGQSIVVKKAPTVFGEMAVVSHSEGDTITVDVDSPKWESPKEIRLVVRHPERKAIVKATVNGKPAVVNGETIVLPAPTGQLQIVCKY